MYKDGDVSAVRAAEFGADMKGSWIRRSCGEMVPRLEAELLDILPLKSNDERTAGEEKAVDAPPSKTGRSSKTTSAAFIIFAD